MSNCMWVDGSTTSFWIWRALPCLCETETEDPNILDRRKIFKKLSSNVTWVVGLGWLVIPYQIRRRLAAPGRSLLWPLCHQHQSASVVTTSIISIISITIIITTIIVIFTPIIVIIFFSALFFLLSVAAAGNGQSINNALTTLWQTTGAQGCGWGPEQSEKRWLIWWELKYDWQAP